MDDVAKLYGYNGTLWRRLQMLWGYTDRWAETQFNLNCAIGLNTLTFTAVPVGYVYTIQSVSGYNANTNPTSVQFISTGGGTAHIFKVVALPGIAIPVVHFGELTLKAGDVLTVQMYGCALNDDILASVWGNQMRIDNS